MSEVRSRKDRCFLSFINLGYFKFQEKLDIDKLYNLDIIYFWVSWVCLSQIVENWVVCFCSYVRNKEVLVVVQF